MSSDIFLYLAYLFKTYFVSLPTKIFHKLTGILFCFLSFPQMNLATNGYSKHALICIKSLVQQPHPIHFMVKHMVKYSIINWLVTVVNSLFKLKSICLVLCKRMKMRWVNWIAIFSSKHI